MNQAPESRESRESRDTHSDHAQAAQGDARQMHARDACSPMLFRIEKARCRVGRRELLEIDHFEVAVGEHWCIYGPNGAGKSLLAALIAGRRPETGSYVRHAADFDPARDILPVSFEEQQRLWRRDERLDISDYSEEASDRGTSASELIRAALPAAEQDEELFEALGAELDLTALLGRGIRFLSSGQIRRVLIARALYGQRGGRPKLLIFDEPLEALDRESRGRVAAAIAAHLGPDCASLHLCRREQDRFPGATHLLVMERLRALEQEAMNEAAWERAVARFRSRGGAVPERIPRLPGSARKVPAPDEKLIELRNVNAGYGDLPVLRDVDWTMEGRHHVLVEGPNGCGKSTLLSLIDGDNHLGYGQEVYLFGRRKGSGETVWDIKRRFGVVSSELHNRYAAGWKVLDVVVSGFFDSVGLYDDSGGAEQDHARAWLETLHIAHLAGSFYHRISFGQQRLALLARAMVKQPEILILDEPCVGLDDYHRDFILGTLDAIAERTSTRLIHVSHVPGENPACINCRLHFEAAPDGGYRLRQSEIRERAAE